MSLNSTDVLDRVVIINDRAQPVGGASGLALLAAELLASRGVPITFFTGDDGQSCPLPETDADVISLDSRPLTERSRLSAFTTGLYNPKTVQVLQAWMQKHDTRGTIYHVHGWSKILSPSLFRALEPVAARVVFHAHDYFLACPNGAYTNFPTNQVCALRPLSSACLTTQCDKRGYSQKIWRVARHALCNRFLDLTLAPSDVIVIHPGMVEPMVRGGIDRYRIHPIRNPCEPFCGDGVDAAINRSFFFIGRLEPEKGFADAAEAARLAGIPLEVIGDGPGRALLERDYPEVFIHGWKKRDEIGALIRKARVVIVPSRVPEPFGLVAIEALSSGIPVAITDKALLADEIVAHGMGESYAANDISALTAVLRNMSIDDRSVNAMSKLARQHASTMANTPDQWCDLLLERYADRFRCSKAEFRGQVTVPGIPHRQAAIGP